LNMHNRTSSIRVWHEAATVKKHWLRGKDETWLLRVATSIGLFAFDDA